MAVANADAIVLAAVLSMACYCASAQYSARAAARDTATPERRSCGSVVLLHCPTTAARGALRGAPAQWEAARWAESSDDEQIVITGGRLRHETIGSVFQRDLASGGPGTEELSTTDRGAGVRCTVTRTGQIYCSRAANETPGTVGVQTDWSDWSF
jgi:hypothetical protein